MEVDVLAHAMGFGAGLLFGFVASQPKFQKS
jgi:hypothetical protein